MSLYGALFSGVSGLSAQSSAMGAIADNVTNVNTIGYKKTHVQFQTLVTKQIAMTRYAPGGVQARPISGVDLEGLLQATSSATDMGISGQGMFVVNESALPSPTDIYAYTRAGSFRVDKDGYLVNTAGWYLQGWPLQNWDTSSQAVIKSIGDGIYMKAYKNETGETVYINDNVVERMHIKPFNVNTIGGTATATTTFALGANLPSGAQIGAVPSKDQANDSKVNYRIFDSLGNAHSIAHHFIKRDENAWDFYAIPPKGSKEFVVRDQTSAQNAYYAAGRLDFHSKPDLGSSMDVSIAGTEYKINFTTDDQEDVMAQTLTVNSGVSNGHVFSMTIPGVPNAINFEFSTDNTVGQGNIKVPIGNDTTSTTTALKHAIEDMLDAKLGKAEWTTVSNDKITFRPTRDKTVGFSGNGVAVQGDLTQTLTFGTTDPAVGNQVRVTPPGGTALTFEFVAAGGTATAPIIAVEIGADRNESMANLQAAMDAQPTLEGRTNISGDEIIFYPADANNAFTVTGAASIGVIQTKQPETELNINVAGSDNMEALLDSLAERLRTIQHYELGGMTATPPDEWAQRLSGEHSVYFIQGSTQDDMIIDASRLTTDGRSSVIQNESFTVTKLDGSVAWTDENNYGVKFGGDGTPDEFFGSDEADATDPRATYNISWANGAYDMGGNTAIRVFLGNYNTRDGLTQFAGEFNRNYTAQNGSGYGNFKNVSIGQDGVVTATFDNGAIRPVFMIPIATMTNPNGLEARTGNVYIETDLSGQPVVREAGTGGAGNINAAALEASTVDLGTEFTSMITTQRAYSAAAKIITTADEMLDELLRIKR